MNGGEAGGVVAGAVRRGDDGGDGGGVDRGGVHAVDDDEVGGRSAPPEVSAADGGSVSCRWSGPSPAHPPTMMTVIIAAAHRALRGGRTCIGCSLPWQGCVRAAATGSLTQEGTWRPRRVRTPFPGTGVTDAPVRPHPVAGHVGSVFPDDLRAVDCSGRHARCVRRGPLIIY